MANTLRSLTGTLILPGSSTPAAAARLRFRVVSARGREVAAPTNAPGVVMLGESQEVVTDGNGDFTAELLPSIDADWGYELVYRLPGEAPRSLLLRPMPDRDATFEELIPPIAEICSTRGAKFTDLLDTPAGYSGQAGRVAVVDDDERGLAFSASAGGGGGGLPGRPLGEARVDFGNGTAQALTGVSVPATDKWIIVAPEHAGINRSYLVWAATWRAARVSAAAGAALTNRNSIVLDRVWIQGVEYGFRLSRAGSTPLLSHADPSDGPQTVRVFSTD